MAFAQVPAVLAETSTLHARVLETYNFTPHDLNDAAIREKSVLLDSFWSEVKSLGESGLPALREELGRSDAPVFFRYDGAKLLLSLSNTRSDKQLALISMERADLRDLERSDYFFTIHSLSVDKFNTTAAALRILEDAEFQVFVPEHFLTLGQNYCLVYMLLPLDDEVYIDRVIERLGQAKAPKEQQSLLLVLAYTVTPQADSAIVKFAADESRPSQSRAYANNLIRAWGIAPAFSDKQSQGTITALKAERRQLMSRVSDEALIELDGITKKIRHAGL